MAEREEAEIKEEGEEKWVKHYSSLHQILLVGEGDFSFSKSLAQSFGSACNIVASSLDSYGFHGKEDDNRLIKKHRNLVNGFFGNASGMLRVNGEIHVNHKTTSPFCDWNLEELGSKNSLVLIETVVFKKEDYPGYNNKRGSGSRCDEPFPLGDCCTFKFMFSPAAKKVTRVKNNLDLTFRKSQELIEASIILPWKPNSLDLKQVPNVITSINSIQVLNLPYGRSQELLEAPRQPYYGNFSHPPSNFIPLISGIPQFIGSPSTVNASVEWSRIFKGHFEHVVEAFGSHDFKGSYFLYEALKLGYGRYMAEDPARTPSGYISILEELRYFSIARQESSRRMPVALEFQR